MRRFLATAACGLFAFGTCAANLPAQDLGQQEIVAVRATYAKLAFALHLHAIHEASMGAQSIREQMQAPDTPLTVSLSDFSAGPVASIEITPLEELVTRPSGYILSVTSGSIAIKLEDGTTTLHSEGAQAAWQQSSQSPEDWNVPMGRLFTLGVLDRMYTRYVSFKVALTYEGKAREYKALFLFGHDASGKEQMMPIDHIVGISALAAMAEASPMPDILKASPFQGRADVASFLTALRAPAGCTPEPHTQMCCDANSGRCGVDTDTLQRHGLILTGTGLPGN